MISTGREAAPTTGAVPAGPNAGWNTCATGPFLVVRISRCPPRLGYDRSLERYSPETLSYRASLSMITLHGRISPATITKCRASTVSSARSSPNSGRQGVFDDTFIVVMADNGRPFARAKTRLLPDGIHTPFVVRYPAGMRAKAEVCNSL